jgi:hypothetical protein
MKGYSGYHLKKTSRVQPPQDKCLVKWEKTKNLYGSLYPASFFLIIEWTFTFKCGAIRIKKYDNFFFK